MNRSDLRPAVFLDRDGTLIEDRGHLRRTQEVSLFPCTVSALRRLQEAFLLFIVTNQSGVAEGELTCREVERVNGHVVRQLAEAGVRIAETYTCPHKRADGCECIKPNPHFLFLAASDHHVDLRRSFVIGDHPHDVELARNAGAQGVYVYTGHGRRHADELSEDEVIAYDVFEAAEWILSYSIMSCTPS